MASTSKKSRRPWIILIVVIVVVVVVVVGFMAVRGGRRGTSASSATLTSTVTRGDVAADVTASGQIVNEYTYSVAAGSPAILTERDGVAANSSSAVSTSTTSTSTTSGSGSSSGGSTGYKTTELKVKVGDKVSSGQLLAKATASTSDLGSLQAAVTSANASLSSAYSALSEDQSSYNSVVDTSAPTSTINGARKQVSADDAAISAAKSAQTAALSNRNAHGVSIKSPAAGRILSVGTAVGASASPVAVIGAGTTELSVMVSEYNIPSIQLKQVVDVTLGSGATQFSGTVARISPESTDASGVQQYQVIVTSNDLPATAMVGMTATANIKIATHRSVLHVPASAVTTSGGRSTVTVVAANGGQSVKTVHLGLVGDDAVEITSGLRAGEKVVTGATGTVPAATTGGAGGRL